MEFVALFAVVVYLVKSGRDTKKNTFVAVLIAVFILHMGACLPWKLSTAFTRHFPHMV